MATGFAPDVSRGLTAEQVNVRVAKGLVNAPPKSITRTVAQIVYENVFTLFNGIMFAIFIALVWVGSYHNLLFMGVVLSNLCIGIVQELKSKRAVEKLSLLNSPRAVVVRDGQEIEIKSEQIVLDDVVALGLGQQVPADCVILSGAVETDESLLSGESEPLFKKQGDALLSGSVVVSGACRVRIVRIGAECYAHTLAAEARRYKRPKSELMRSLRIIVRGTGILVLPLGLLMFVRAYVSLSHSLQSSVEQAAGAMIGMIPAGLMLLASISLSVGVITLGRRNTLAQQPHCIEMLSRVDMLCLDKTGTLTTGNIKVSKLIAAKPEEMAAAEAWLGSIVAALPAANPTARALAAYIKEKEIVAGAEKAKAITAFSSARRYSAASFSDGTVYLGAPEVVAAPLPKELQAEANRALSEGYRVLALSKGPAAEIAPPPETQELTPLCLLLLQDEIRPEAEDTLAFFQREGVCVKLITGDNPQTASHIARRLGVPGAEKLIDLSGLSEEEVRDVAAHYTVFGRVSPMQKRQLVMALKACGHTVAMTGDGVNDLLALREADCSIALFNGSDAARQIAQLVLLTNDFSALPAAVMEGRRVINNITRTASLFLVKTIYSFLLTASSVLFQLAYPLQPVQLSLISSVTVGIPSFFLSLEANRTRIEGNFLRNVLEKALPGGLIVFLYLVIAGSVGKTLGLSYPQINTLCVYLAGTANLCVLFRVCLPLMNYRGMLFFTMMALFFGLSIALRRMLELTLPPNGPMLWMYACMAAACYPLMELLVAGLRRAFRARHKDARQGI